MADKRAASSEALTSRLRVRAHFAREEANATATCDAIHFDEAADRIDALEEGLRVICEEDCTINDARHVARALLVGAAPESTTIAGERADDLLQQDLGELLRLLNMGDHARPQSPHDTFQSALRHLRHRLAVHERTVQALRDLAAATDQAGEDARAAIAEARAA